MQQAQIILEQVIQAQKSGNTQLIQQKMAELKPIICNMDSLDPSKGVFNQAEIQLARQFYEINCQNALSQEQYKQYEQSMLILRVFYEDFPQITPSTQYSYQIQFQQVYLYNFRFEDFHTILELIPLQYHQNNDIQLVLKIQSFLQQGNYKQIRDLSQNQNYSLAMKSLFNRIHHTIRYETARNIEKAYDSLSIQDALNILNIKNINELIQFIGQQSQQDVNWQVQNERLYFIKQDSSINQINADQSIKTMINYTLELDKVI